MNAKEEKLKRFKKLLTGIARGDKGALEELYNDYARLITATAVNVCKDESIADEVVTEVLARIWRAAGKSSQIKNPEGWIYVITVNTAKTRLARNKDYVPLEECISEGETPERKLIGEDSFYSMIEGLSEGEREIIILRIIGEVPFDDIAAETGRPLSTVTSLYYRALNKIREKYKKQ